MIPSKAEKVKAYATVLEDQETLTIKQLLLDLEDSNDLVDYIMSGDEDRDKDGDSDDNGVDDGDRDDVSITDSG